MSHDDPAGTDATDMRWLDRPSTHELIWRLLVGACVALVVGEILFEAVWHTGHPHFGFDGIWGFHGMFGFAAFITAVLLGKQLRRLIKRPEGYYDPDSLDRKEDA